MKLRSLLLAVVGIGLLSMGSLAMAQEPTEHQPGKGAIKGMVVNTQQQPLAGVKLVFKLEEGFEVTVETDENGEFFIDNVPPGTYAVHVEKEGYHPFDDTLQVDPDVLTTYRVTIVTEAEAKELRGGELWKQAEEAFRKRQFKDAEARFQAITEMDPTYANAFFNLGLVQAILGKCEEALTNLKRAQDLQFQPEGQVLITYYAGLARCHEQMKQWDKAVEDYQNLAKLLPNNAGIYLNMGTCYINLQQYDKALEAYQKFLRLEPNAREAPKIRKIVKQLKEALKQQKEQQKQQQ